MGGLRRSSGTNKGDPECSLAILQTSKILWLHCTSLMEWQATVPMQALGWFIIRKILHCSNERQLATRISCCSVSPASRRARVAEVQPSSTFRAIEPREPYCQGDHCWKIWFGVGNHTKFRSGGRCLSCPWQHPCLPPQNQRRCMTNCESTAAVAGSRIPVQCCLPLCYWSFFLWIMLYSCKWSIVTYR